MSDPDFQPTLVGPTITIRPISPGDWPELFAAASDPEIWKVHPVPDRYTEPVFRKFFDGAIESKKAFVFVDRASNRLVGARATMTTSRKRAKSRSAGRFSPAAIGAAPPTAR